MTEAAPQDEHGGQRERAESPAPDAAHVDPVPATGVPEVDAVLDEVAALEDRPVEEHVAVFEDAHQRLRQALDGETAPDAG